MIIKIVVAAITGAFLTSQLKNVKPEYGQVLLMSMGIFLFYFAVSYLDVMKSLAGEITKYITLKGTYLSVLIKMTGIAYVCEFAASLCIDAGCQTIATQVELIGKLSMMVLSMPIVTSLVELVGKLF